MKVRELISISHKDNTKENIAKHADAEVIVNATPVGMFPNNRTSPTSLEHFPKCTLVLDVIYNPARTELLLEAERRGITAVNGLPMLVAQAARAYEYFTGDTCEESDIEKIISDIGKEMRNIILVGMPGCGKSTVGKILANKLDRSFYDADEEFTKMHGLTPAEAITSLGEQRFREMEHSTLEAICKISGAVIATGGGAVTREYNYPTLHQNGTIIFLERALDKLTSRGRPLSQSTSIEELYKKRKDLYFAFSDIRVESTEVPALTADKISDELCKFNYTCVFKK
jgi:shikimate dehydrogenase